MTNDDIINISNEMRVQDNRATQFPLFVIMDKVRVVAHEDYCDGSERREDYEYDNLCEQCKKLEDDDEEIPYYCENCDSAMMVPYKDEDRPQLDYGVFFTAKACEECIQQNKYHFNKPFSYGIGAWRNHEMQSVLKHLLQITGEVPSHYNS